MKHERGYKCPVKEGDIIEAKCEGKGTKGDGICKIDGFVIIVPGTEIDQTYKIKINAVRGRVAFGEITPEEKAQSETSPGFGIP